MQTIDEKKNGLQLLSGRSHVEPNPPGWRLDNLTGLITAKFGDNEATAVFYLDYGIRFAKWRDHTFEFAEASTSIELRFLQLARIFNQNSELKIWRSDEGFGYRWRIDDQGKDCFAIDAEQNLWGTHAELPVNGWTRLWEDRGTELTLPLIVEEITLKNDKGEDDKYDGQLACVKTRNYIGEMANGQTTYVDCRFVELRARRVGEVK